MIIEKIYYQINKGNITCSINIYNKSDENELLIECHTSFNNYLYFSLLNFKNKESFLNCSSSNETIDLLIKYFYKRKFFIKDINNTEIIFWIYCDSIYNEFEDNFSINEIRENDFYNIDDISNIYIFKIKNSIYSDSNKNLISKENNNGYIYHPIRKKKEYVFWRDGNFIKLLLHANYFQKFRMLCSEKLNMNIYFEISIEKSLKFLLINKFDKVILISNIGLDLSGKRFVEIARKILGFDIIVLFYSNNLNHLKWVSEFPNCLFSSKYDIYEEYITNYNCEGLKNLKRKIEKIYNISLKKFSDDFILYPNYEKKDNSSSTDNINEYIRHVYIFCENQNLYLCMGKEGEVYINEKGCPWDVTILDKEITLFSNGFYLDIKSDKNNIIGFRHMRIWNFEIIDDNYYFINPKKYENNILSIENGEIKAKKSKADKNEKFKLIDIPDSCNDIFDSSFLSLSDDINASKTFFSEKIIDLLSDISISDGI